MKKTAGSVAGTHVIVLDGGPPQWDGTVTAVSSTATGTLERWDKTADLAYVWEPTTEEREVEVDRETRAGNVREKRAALVYRAVGYREDIVAEQDRTEEKEGRTVRGEDVPQAAPDGQLQIADTGAGEDAGRRSVL